MKPVCRAPAVLALVPAALLTAACSNPEPVPPDYLRIGAVGSDVLYAKVAHASEGDYADVLLRTRDGDTLCDARGALMTSAAPDFALCSDRSPGMYVWVAQTSKTEPAQPLCRDDGRAVAAERLETDTTWPADFSVWVERSDDQFSSVLPCSALVAE